MTPRLLRLLLPVLLAALPALPAAAAEPQALGPYPPLEQVEAEIRALAQDHPGRAELLTLGSSTGGRPLYAVKISRGDGQARAEALVAGNIHGDEPIGNRTAMALAQALLAGTDPDAVRLLDLADVYIIPLLNPDGYAATLESQAAAPVKQRRTNGRQVDLNRNFPRPGFGVWLPLGYSGSKDPDSTRYTGPQPLSEPESRAVRDLAAGHHFFADVDYHCAAGMVIPGKCKTRECHLKVKRFSQAYRRAQENPYQYFGRPPWFPVYQGNMEDFLLDEYGMLSVLIELGDRREIPAHRDLFWKMNPPDPQAVIANNVHATIAALLEGYAITGGRPLEPGRR